MWMMRRFSSFYHRMRAAYFVTSQLWPCSNMLARAKISDLFCDLWEIPIELIVNYSEAVCTEEVLSANSITFPFSLAHFSWKKKIQSILGLQNTKKKNLHQKPEKKSLIKYSFICFSSHIEKKSLTTLPVAHIWHFAIGRWHHTKPNRDCQRVLPPSGPPPRLVTVPLEEAGSRDA